MYLAKRYQKLVIRSSKSGKTRTLYSTNGNGLALDAEIHGYANGKAKDGNFTIYNTGKTTTGYLKRGNTIHFYAGYVDPYHDENNISLQIAGEIKTVGAMTKGAVDRPITFTAEDGKNFEDAKKVAQRKTKTVKKVDTKNLISVSKTMKSYDQAKTKELNAWLKDHKNAKTHEKALERKKVADAKKKQRQKVTAKYNSQKKSAEKHAKKTKKVTYKSYTFKKGTKAASIIKFMASKADIPIGALKLTKNKVYKKGYTASKNAMTTIKAVAKACRTDLRQVNGKLYIEPLTKGNTATKTITYSSGLIQEPEVNDDGKVSGWTVTTLALPWVTCGTLYNLKSQTHSAKEVVYGFTHTFNHDEFKSETNVIDATEYEKSAKKGNLVSFE